MWHEDLHVGGDLRLHPGEQQIKYLRLLKVLAEQRAEGIAGLLQGGEEGQAQVRGEGDGVAGGVHSAQRALQRVDLRINKYVKCM